MISTTSKLFVFAFAALSISALFSTDIEKKKSTITGAAKLLANLSMFGGDLKDALITLANTLSFEPVVANDYVEALKLIISYLSSNMSEILSSEKVDDFITGLESDFAGEFKNDSIPVEKFKVRLEQGLRTVITFMKRELLYLLLTRKLNLGSFTLKNRVAELKSALGNQITNLHDLNKIDDTRYHGLKKQLAEISPEIDSNVQALIGAATDNADLLAEPARELEKVLDIQLGQIETEKMNWEGGAWKLVFIDRIQVTFDLIPCNNRGEKVWRFINTLLGEVELITLRQNTFLRPRTTPETVLNARVFFGDLIGAIAQKEGKTDKEFPRTVLNAVSAQFKSLLPRFHDSYLKVLQSSDIFSEFSSYSSFGRDDESAKSLKFKKFLNIIAVSVKADTMSPQAIPNFMTNLGKYLNIFDNEIQTLGLLTNYFSETSAVEYLENTKIFWLAFVTFVEFISVTDRETLSTDNLFSHFDAYLTKKANFTKDSEAKWRLATFRIANFLQSPRNFDLRILPLDASGVSFFVDDTPHNFFRKTHKKILDLLLKDNTEIVATLTRKSEVPVDQRVLLHWERIFQQVKDDQAALSSKKELDPEQGKRLLRLIAKMLTFGLNFAAESRHLI